MGNESAEPRDPNHIWLRQSVTFTVNGQTRTVEMALPLRPGATPGEVEALLDEADAGMRRLSRRLDTHLAELLTPPAAPAAASASVARPVAAQPPAADLTIPDFIAQAAALGLNQRQAMDKLRVRSLSGLNLREALESLRRLAVLDGASPAGPTPASAPLLAFEEEEEDHDALASEEPELALSYPDPAGPPEDDDDMEDEEDFLAEDSAAPASPIPAPDLSALRRDARLTPASKLPAPAPRRASQPPRESAIAEAPAAPLAPEPEPAETPESRAERILAELRATHSGGAVSDYQRAALRNVVVSELTEKGVEALTRAVWNIAPKELGADQYDALINWGKRDHFRDDARAVVLAARASAQAAATPHEAPAAPQQPPARGAARSTTRPRPASQPEKPRGSH